MHTLVTVLSGIALLVWGTHIVRSGVLRVLGGSLRRVLASSTGNPFTAFLAGLGVTGLVQSSSATALLTSSFVGQNLMPLAPALAIMLGADVGTSLVVQLFSFDLSWLSPLLIGVGVLFHLTRKATREGQIGRIAIGLGLIILALQIILQAARPLTGTAGVQVIFGSLTILFFLLAIGDFINASPGFRQFAGYEGIFCGFSAIYAGVAQVLNEIYGKVILPLGAVEK